MGDTVHTGFFVVEGLPVSVTSFYSHRGFRKRDDTSSQEVIVKERESDFM